MPTGHLLVDHEEPDGQLRLVAQHMPLADLMITMDRTIRDHRSGEPIDVDYEGLVAICQQPWEGADARPGERRRAGCRATDVVGGGVLTTSDTTRRAATEGQLAAIGSTRTWSRNPGGTSTTTLRTPSSRRSRCRSTRSRGGGRPACWTYEDACSRRRRRAGPEADDGYVAVVVHCDGPKELQLFDAGDLGSGPVARATAPDFNPALLLHSCWMPDRVGPRSSSYRVSRRRGRHGSVLGEA